MKQRIKKAIIKYFKLRVEKGAILILRKDIPFLERVSLSSPSLNQHIYLIKTRWSHVINLATVDNLYSYSIYFHMKFFHMKTSIRVPIGIMQLVNSSNLYTKYKQAPVKKGLIVFESFFGKNYAGQPKYIYEYLLSQDLPYTYVWTYQKEDSSHIPGNPIIVKRGTPEYFEYLATAEYWINNIVFPVLEKRKETTYLQTWHGTPLKRLGFDIEVEGPEVDAREKFYKESRNWDYLITQNHYSTEILARAFRYENEVIESGYPHNDILVKNDPHQIAKIRENLNIENGKKIILYAPTWRDNDANGNWSFNFTLRIDLKTWQEELGDEYVLLVRMHHLISHIKGLEEAEGFAYNVSDYDDVQELNLISDILITDYSSVFFDYAVTKKPILFFAYDLKEYEEKLRGFYLDMHSQMPGPIIDTDAALLDAVREIDKVKQDYKEKYEVFAKKFCYLDDGYCAQRVARHVFKELHE
jgi:CDP-glycerol glycerophosphotransferase